MVPARRRRSLSRIPHPCLDPAGGPVIEETVKPLRREVHIPIYWLVVGLMVMVVSPIVSIVVSVQKAQNTFDEAQRAQARARVEAVAVYCRLIGVQVDVYSEATTPVGKRAYVTWLDEYRRSGCQPGR